MDFEKIFEPLKIGNMTLHNRLIMPAMGDNHGNPDHTLGERSIAYYAERAKGGFGLVMTEVCAVVPEGCCLAHEHGIWDSSFIPGFRKLADEVHKWGSKLCVQLHHAGREATCLSQPVAPSAIKMTSSPYFASRVPRELTTKEVWDLINDYGNAALRARVAGADAVEVHGAHQYLVAQFLSPASNKRTDEFGGNFENRMRFATEIIKNIREKAGDDFPIIFRISGDERVVGGRTVLQSKAVAKMLEKAGADAIHISVGNGSTNATVAPASYPEGHIIEDAAEIKKAVSVPVIGVGRMHDPYLIEMVLEDELVDAVSVGRQAIADPFFPNKIKAELISEICPCVSCLQGCVGRINDPKYLGIGCLMNPFVGHEHEWNIVSSDTKKKIVVVGAGPAGMQFAWISAARGHDVIIYEKSDRVGGQVLLAMMPPAKQFYAQAIRYWETMCRKYHVKIRLNAEADLDQIREERPDAVVIAAGAIPIKPSFKGIENVCVADAWDVLAGKNSAAHKSIIIGGGLVGCETASYLVSQSHDVSIIEMQSELISEMEAWQKWAVKDLIQEVEENCNIYTSSKVVEILEDGVVVERNGQMEHINGYGNVILACGAKPVNIFTDSMEEFKEVYCIGDVKKARKIIDATEEATILALKI